MPTSTVTSKGQVTIPAEVRKRLGLRSGSRVHFVPTGEGTYQFVPATETVTSLKGIIATPAKPVTLQQMDAAIAAGAADGVVD